MSSTTAINTNFNPVIAAIADLNGDGNPDLVVINNSFVLPAGAQSQVEVFLGNGDGTFKAPTTVTTTAQGGCTQAYQANPTHPWYAGASALACLLFLVVPSWRRWSKWLAMLFLVIALTAGVSACGGSSSKATCTAITAGTTAGSYTITVTGTSGSITQTTVVSLTVN